MPAQRRPHPKKTIDANSSDGKVDDRTEKKEDPQEPANERSTDLDTNLAEKVSASTCKGDMIDARRQPRPKDAISINIYDYHDDSGNEIKEVSKDEKRRTSGGNLDTLKPLFSNMRQRLEAFSKTHVP